MSLTNHKDKSSKKGKYLSTASAMVALSAFVPNPNGAYAQTPTATFTPSATVVDAINITAQQQLKFGKFVVGGAGTVIINTAGDQSDIGANLTAVGGNATNGILRFNAVANGAGNTIRISVPELSAPGIQLTNSVGTPADKMTITKLVFAADTKITTVNGNAATGTFALNDITSPGDNTATVLFTTITAADLPIDVAFGGQLKAAGTEASGTYTGAFTVQVTFP